MGFHGECGRGWSGRCANSKGLKCRCRCGGANHGKTGRQLRLDFVPLAPGRRLSGQVVTGGARRSCYRIEETAVDAIVIRDVGPWDQHLSVTNDAERVVAELAEWLNGRRLFYYDSDNALDEIVITDGRFAGFLPGPRRGEPSTQAAP